MNLSCRTSCSTILLLAFLSLLPTAEGDSNTTCLTLSGCAVAIAASCNSTCSLNSTCFTNATNYCCADRNATADYVKNVTDLYQLNYCTRSCVAASSCATTISTACNSTCSLNSTCFTNATKFCCSDRNATADYVKNVTDLYQLNYCTRSCVAASNCTSSIASACNSTCSLNSTCFTNATKFCCTDRNATADYVKNVTDLYQRTYCNRTRACLTLSNCTSSIASACNRTCDFNSTCFTNAAKSCCTGRNATAAYINNVTAVYRQQNPVCTRDNCANFELCATQISRSCNSTCNFNSTCFTNATNFCCLDRNPTADYVKNVTDDYQRRFCTNSDSSCIAPNACARRINGACKEPRCRNTTTKCFRRRVRRCCSNNRATPRYKKRVKVQYDRVRNCRVACLGLEQCVNKVANSCNSTCTLNSGCFLNATMSCCPSGNLTDTYRTFVRRQYRQKFCNRNRCSVDDCALRAARCRGRNCVINQQCFRNVTNSCCLPSNVTRPVFKERVRTQVKRLCRRSCTLPKNPLETCARRVREGCRNTCSNRNKKCFRRVLQSCCVKGRISVWSNLVMRKYSRMFCRRKVGLGLGLLP